jgi:hypothetical protein
MKHRTLLFALAPLLSCAAPAAAAGINLGWNDCPSGFTYALTETFLCDTNSGTPHTLVGSFVAPAGVIAMSGNEIVIDMMTGGYPLADWWSLRATSSSGCRAGSMTYSLDFTGGPGTCSDYWQGGAYGGISMDPPSGNRARIKMIADLPAGDPLIRAIPEGTEVYSFKIIIDNAKTAGIGACGGCTDEACIVFTNLGIVQPVQMGPRIRMDYPSTSQHVLWQGWTNPDPQLQCPAVTPARTQTWGAIKALYR